MNVRGCVYAWMVEQMCVYIYVRSVCICAYKFMHIYIYIYEEDDEAWKSEEMRGFLGTDASSLFYT